MITHAAVWEKAAIFIKPSYTQKSKEERAQAWQPRGLAAFALPLTGGSISNLNPDVGLWRRIA
jgi:hypothetical protein